ncbi:MAG: cellulase family glycosylhydrolase [Bacteroidales bacterium]|nr:cellulase family glycosylhydrolase [Lachnoclostridium sp.]MCM1384293.1 cellulase family glycosylhydrolase [Lachnoclostridium sp.]MCM1464793.1 cellulase family glycosylhydrolase [Bacteroidales bacterium]
MDTESTKSAEDKKISVQRRLPFLIGGAVIIVLLIALIAVIAENSALRRAALSNSADSLQDQEEMSQADASHIDATDNMNASNGDNSQASGTHSLQIADKPAAGDGYTVTYSAGNGWTDGDTKMCSLELSVTNHSDTAIEGWNLALQVDGLVSAQGWDGTWSVDGDVVTITNAEYNKTIAPGASVVLGCNMGTKTDLSIVSAALNDAGCNVEKGNVDRNAQNNNQQNGNGQVKGKDVSELLARSEDAVQGDDWLFTDGNKIVDKDGKQVWLTGVNWFGYNTGTNTFDGLWNSQLVPTVKGIADHGFNLIRVPMSAELINQWAAGEYPRANYNNAYNEELNAMNSLEIFDYFLALAEENGIKVMIDIHSAETNASGHTVNLWYTDKVTVEDYYAALEWMAERYKDNDTVIAYDLKNEPHGKPNEGKNAAVWNDSKDANNWKYVAETAAAKVLSKNPNVLILVEGTEIYPMKKGGDYSSTDSGDYYFNWWGGNLRAVADYPINLGKYQNKLVYSPHDYGPTVYEQPWFQKNYTYDSLMEDCWHDNWFYIYEEDIAPLLIGEWGGFMREPNLTWMTYMRQLIGTYHLNHTFWCLNANSGDTGGLLLDDFTTWDSEKYNFVKEVLWQENGKFVGLDHAIPLGENGITLEEAKGLK